MKPNFDRMSPSKNTALDPLDDDPEETTGDDFTTGDDYEPKERMENNT